MGDNWWNDNENFQMGSHDRTGNVIAETVHLLIITCI